MVEFRINDKEVAEAYQEVPQALARETRRAVSGMLSDFTRTIKGDQFEGYAARTSFGFAGRDKLRTRSGALRNSIRATRVTGETFEGIEGRAFTASPYAPVHEFGATITPKKQYLKIPLDYMLTPSGVVSGAREAEVKAGKTFTLPSKRNPSERVVYLDSPRGRSGRSRYGRRGAGDGPVPIYALKKSVKVPGGRLRFFDTWDELSVLRNRRLVRAARIALSEATA